MSDTSENTTIKFWKKDDRPREKLLLKGKGTLSDAELMAILIGSGNKEESAVALAKRILAASDNNLNYLGRLTANDLMKFKGIGEAKAINIIAALELGNRKRLEQAMKQAKINSSRSVFEIMQPVIGDLSHEEFWVLYLNNANKIRFKDRLSSGGITGTVVDVRLILKKALELNAVGLVICHNHPSGNLSPSMSDKQLTQKVKQAGKTLDIKLLDHLIITEKEYFSFADHNIL